MVEIGLEDFLKRHEVSLEHRSVLPSELNVDGVFRDILELEHLAALSTDLAVLCESVHHPINANESLHDIVRRVAAFVPERTLKIYDSYVDRRNIIDDETYSHLQTPRGIGTDEIMVHEFTDFFVTIDDAFYRITHRTHPDTIKKGEAKKNKGTISNFNKFDPNAMRSIIDMNKRFDAGKTLTGPRKAILRKAIVGRIEANRESYVARRAGYEQAVAEFETQTDLLLDEEEISQKTQALSGWNPGGVYSDLNKNLEQEDGLLDQEKKDFLRRLEQSRKLLQGVIPGLSVGVYESIKEEAQGIIARFEGIFTDVPDLVKQKAIINDYNSLEQAVESLENPKLGDITKVIIEKSPPEVKKALALAKEHIEFYRMNLKLLETMQSFVTGDATIIDSDDYSSAASAYKDIFGTYSWHNKQHYVGAHLVAFTIKERFEVAIKEQIADAVLTLRDKYSATILSGGEPSPELEQEANSLSALISRVNLKKRDALVFNKFVGSLDEIAELEEALREPAEALETRDTLRTLGKAALDGSPNVEGIRQIVSTYSETTKRINAILDELGPETPFIDSLEGIVDESIRRLQGNLSTRFLGILQHTRREDMRKLGDGEFSVNKRIVDYLAAIVDKESLPISNDVQLQLDRQIGIYDAENEYRDQPFQKLSRWTRKKVNPFGQKKIYVLDTNVLIQNPDAIETFGDNIVVIPLEVLSELDNLKRSDREGVAHSARLAIKKIDAATGYESNGLKNEDEKDSHEHKKGEQRFYHRIERFFKNKDAQRSHRIAPGAYSYELERSGISTQVILYDQDQGLRRKALRRRSGNKHEQRLFTNTELKKTCMDDAIIHATHRIRNALKNPLQPSRPVIFVAKDINARIKARTTGLATQDYRHDKVVENTTGMYTGYRYVNLPLSLQKSLLSADISEEVLGHILEVSSDGQNIVAPRNRDWGRDAPLMENEFVIWRNSGEMLQTSIFRYRHGELRPLDSLNPDAQVFPLQYFEENANAHWVYGIRPRNAKQVAAMDLLLDDTVELLSIAGLPGSGKTFLCTAAFLEMIFKSDMQHPFEKVYLTKPNVEVGEGHGHLKGTLADKVGPLMMSFYQHIYNLTYEEHGHDDTAAEAILEGPLGKKIQISPLAFMRGADIKYGIRVMDEAQNTRPGEMKTFVTRHSDPTKTIVCGDPDQIDDPRLDSRSNGFAHLRLGFLGEDNYGHITFTQSERSRVAEQGQRLLPYTGGPRR